MNSLKNAPNPEDDIRRDTAGLEEFLREVCSLRGSLPAKADWIPLFRFRSARMAKGTDAPTSKATRAPKIPA